MLRAGALMRIGFWVGATAATGMLVGLAGALAPARAQNPRPGVAVGSAMPSQAVAPVSQPHLEQVPWQRLKFSASKLFLSASTAISADYCPSEAVAGDIHAPAAGVARPLPSPTVAVVTSETDLPFGKHEVATVWLDPATGAALQGHKLVQGRDPYEKIFRYTAEGFFYWRNSPGVEAERKLPPDRWGKRRERLVRSAQPLPTGGAVTDSYALFYLASAARLDRQGARLTTFLLQDEQLVELTFTALEQRQIHCDVRLTGPQGERRQTSALVRRVTLSGRLAGQPPKTKGDDVDLGLLGLRGSLQMLVEVGTGIPIAISGHTASIGELTVHLDRITPR